MIFTQFEGNIKIWIVRMKNHHQVVTVPSCKFKIWNITDWADERLLLFSEMLKTKGDVSRSGVTCNSPPSKQMVHTYKYYYSNHKPSTHCPALLHTNILTGLVCGQPRYFIKMTKVTQTAGQKYKKYTDFWNRKFHFSVQPLLTPENNVPGWSWWFQHGLMRQAGIMRCPRHIMLILLQIIF